MNHLLVMLTYIRLNSWRVLVIIFLTAFLPGCQENHGQMANITTSLPEPKKVAAKIDSSSSTIPAAKSLNPSASNTPITITPTAEADLTMTIPTLTPIPTAVFTQTPTPIGPCSLRMPEDNLLAVVTLEYDLSRDYEPPDLVPLADYLPMSVTLGYPTEIRQVALEPLLTMVEDMQKAGLVPQIISGYRSYAAQSIAWNKWNEKYPDHASIISAPPGHSEHQLGTAVDFGSPELDAIVGQENVEFHTLFYETSEGRWLIENAYKYGFTLSYPLEAFELTGFYYEPWHYRYVGQEMAQRLHELGESLTEYQLADQNIPCIP